MTDDLIHYDYHGSTTHKHMDIKDRAAQFAPFAALVGYDQMIDESNRYTDGTTILADDKANALDHIISLLIACIDTQPSVTITHFIHDPYKDGGRYETLNGQLQKIDTDRGCMIMVDGTTIDLSTIIDIQSDDLFKLMESEDL